VKLSRILLTLVVVTVCAAALIFWNRAVHGSRHRALPTARVVSYRVVNSEGRQLASLFSETSPKPAYGAFFDKYSANFGRAPKGGPGCARSAGNENISWFESVRLQLRSLVTWTVHADYPDCGCGLGSTDAPCPDPDCDAQYCYDVGGGCLETGSSCHCPTLRPCNPC
jgi:hypothetical protein